MRFVSELIKHLKVRTKVLILLGVALSLMIVVGGAGIFAMHKMESKAHALYMEKLMPSSLIVKLLFGNARIDALQLEMLLAESDPDRVHIQQQFDDQRTSNRAIRSQLETIPLSPRAEEQYKHFLSLIPTNNASKTTMDTLTNAGRKDEAYKEYTARYKTNREEMIKSLENAVRFNEEDAQAFYDDTVRAYRGGITITTLVTMLAFILCTWLGLAISNYITRPIIKLRKLMADAQQGDLTVKGYYESSDEVGALIMGFNQMIVGRKEAEDALHHYKENLEELVEQRTIELENKNMLLREAKEIADIANQAKSQFIANVSHEIRTPMNAIMGFNLLLKHSELTNQQKDYVGKSILSATNLLGIINDILDFSKMEAGKMKLEEIDFDLYEVLSNLSNIVSLSASEKGLRLRFDVDHRVPQKLKGDPFRLNQILLNLTNNAIKFTQSGVVAVSVGIQANENKGALLRVEVSDTGIGMTEDQLRQLFLPFSQADMSTTRKYGGTGLGLVITKNLVELLGGTIEVNSEANRGSSFVVTAPFDCSEEPFVDFDRGGDLERLRVLLISDNPEMQSVLNNQFGQFRSSITIAANEKEAIKACSRHPHYELVLIDVELQGSDITRLAETIKSDYFSPKPKIVLVSRFHETKMQEIQASENIDKCLFFPLGQLQLYEEMVSLFKPQTPIMKEISIADEEVAANVISQHIKLLLVEDNEINQIVVIEMIKLAGFGVDVANNGLEAIEMIKAKKYDVVLMDLQMPLMDGYEAARTIRELDPQNDTPIIAMTADAMEDTKRKALEAGMQGYLTKPIDLKQLTSTLQRILENNIIP
ncbi:response regulator [Cohnella soli]|uniref:histidine kinase n=1 Tax=Cohnella soli TaxID=425005 RepID=A0ABW0HJJ4_9BACL